MLRLLVACVLLLASAMPAMAGDADVLKLGNGLLHVDGEPQGEIALPAKWTDDGRGARRLLLAIEFGAPQASWQPTHLLLPFLYDGGTATLNGVQVARISESDTQRNIRWRQPHLFALPEGLPGSRTNRLELDIPIPEAGATVFFPRPIFGSREALAPLFEAREFWLIDMTKITLAVALLISATVLVIWAMRPKEVLYGIFGVATLLWGMRTATFLVDSVPVTWWVSWRAFHHFSAMASGVALAIYAMRFAQWRWGLAERGLLALAMLPPLLIVVSQGRWDLVVGKLAGIVGLVVVGGFACAAILKAVRRQRNAPAWSVFIGFLLIVAAGVHDYFMFWKPDVMNRWLPDWTEQGILLLRYAINILYLAMAIALIHRFVTTLDALEHLNQTLEDRVTAAEARIARDFEYIGRLERERATLDERQRIMQDMHDGLGSRLVTSLAVAEQGQMQAGEMAVVLKDCIGELRLSLDALAPDEGFGSALANFRFRWQQQLSDIGVKLTWRDALPDDLSLSAHATLQILRILQEALTNVVKHAGATAVSVSCALDADGLLCLVVVDNGRGGAARGQGQGRGLTGMRLRAERLGGEFTADSGTEGTRIAFRMSLPSA